MEKKIILSGIQPSGIPTLGNYVGPLRNWKLLQSDDKFCYYCVANMHALTVRQDPKLLLERSSGWPHCLLHAVLIRQLRPFSSRVMCINMLR